MVSAVMPWSSITLEETGRPLRTDEKDAAGYLPVFTTREAAEACIQRARLSDTPAGTAYVLEFTSDDADTAESVPAGHTAPKQPTATQHTGDGDGGCL